MYKNHIINGYHLTYIKIKAFRVSSYLLIRVNGH